MGINVGMSAVILGTKKITQEQLNGVIKEHGLWLKDHSQGKRAELNGYSFGSLPEKIDLDLSGVNLSGADLSGSSFSNINLTGINLSGAKLEGTNFMNVDMTNAILDNVTLCGGSITHSNLTRVHAECSNFVSCVMWNNNYTEAVLRRSWFIEAELCDGNFTSADLSYCDLHGADIDYANFDKAILKNANFELTDNSYWATFKEADMDDIKLFGSSVDDKAVEGAKNLFIPMVCPEEGSFIAWKKCRDGKIAKIMVPEKALRTGGCRYTCRASEVLIIDIFDGENSCEEAISIIDENIVYHKGELVKDEEFDGSLFHEGKGIHFFITRAEAEKTVFDFFIREDEPDEEVEVDNENGN